MDYCEKNAITLFTATGFSHDVGFEYTLSDYLFGREFTPETLIEEQAANGWYEDDDEREQALERLRAVFAAHEA